MRRLVLGIAIAVTSLIPVMGMADDQQIADFIKGRLQAEQKQGNLRGFNVDMRVEQGTVWFKGHVSNSKQELTILQTAQAAGHLGVVKVVDDIEAQPSQGSIVSGAPAPVQSAFRSASYEPPQQPSYQQPSYQQGGYQQSSPFQQASASQDFYEGSLGTIESLGAVENYASEYTGGIIRGEPLPFATADGGGAPLGGASGFSGSPNLPGYAWPGYAASPNYGAVAYPKQHSASAWPYIGPFYPYPQVPLGWRKVSLEWDDGFWHLDFHDK